jgi:hypothetical protein
VWRTVGLYEAHACILRFFPRQPPWCRPIAWPELSNLKFLLNLVFTCTQWWIVDKEPHNKIELWSIEFLSFARLT